MLRSITTLSSFLLLCAVPARTAPDEKFLPPNLEQSGRLACIVEATDPTHHSGDTRVLAQYADGRTDYLAMMSQRDNAKQLALDCAKWFQDVAEAFSKKEK